MRCYTYKVTNNQWVSLLKRPLRCRMSANVQEGKTSIKRGEKIPRVYEDTAVVAISDKYPSEPKETRPRDNALK